MDWKREALLRDLENARRWRDYWSQRCADLERQRRADMAWMEWDGLSSIVSPVEMGEVEREFNFPVPPTSTSPATAVVIASIPDDSGGAATDQRCPNESPQSRPDRYLKAEWRWPPPLAPVRCVADADS